MSSKNTKIAKFSPCSRGCSPALVKEWDFFLPYAMDIEAFCPQKGWKYAVQFGDRPALSRVISKSRPVQNRCTILLPLNTRRHWRMKQVLNEESWDSKIESFVWRGVTTGSRTRREFVHALSGEFNVRFSGVVQGKKSWIRPNSEDLGKHMSRREVLKYKYVLSLPGNDVATNLKWLMMSQSVVVMPRPIVEGFLMEGLLRPYVHYVPLDSPKDAKSTLKWLRANDAACKTIVRNANDWVRKAYSFSSEVATIMHLTRGQTWGQNVTHRRLTANRKQFDNLKGTR